jgi:imidazolonepropionase-like amidohydrolase
LRSATTIAAEVLNMTGKLGRLTSGALADVLIVDGDPTRDVSSLLGQGDHIPLVMKEGVIYVNRL